MQYDRKHTRKRKSPEGGFNLEIMNLFNTDQKESLRDKGVSDLVISPQVKWIDLRYNKITIIGARKLARKLIKMKKLRWLDLTCNFIKLNINLKITSSKEFQAFLINILPKKIRLEIEVEDAISISNIYNNHPALKSSRKFLNLPNEIIWGILNCCTRTEYIHLLNVCIRSRVNIIAFIRHKYIMCLNEREREKLHDFVNVQEIVLEISRK